CGPRGVSGSVDSGIVLRGILIVGSRKESEDPLPGLLREYRSYEGLLEEVALFIDEDEEECFVLDNRTAKTCAKLIAVFLVFLNTTEVVEPVAGIERGVPSVPEDAAPVLVRSRARGHLDLSVTASHFRIHRRRNHPDFFDQVGTDIRGRERT